MFRMLVAIIYFGLILLSATTLLLDNTTFGILLVGYFSTFVILFSIFVFILLKVMNKMFGEVPSFWELRNN